MNTKYMLILSAVISVVFGALASVIPLGFYDQGTVSAMYPTLFTPATITFSIWSVIYLSWFTLGFYEASGKSWVSKKNAYILGTAQIVSSLWLIPSQYLYIYTSLVVMVAVLFLLTLSLIYSRDENMYFRYTVELFFGWILVAFIANIHLTLVAYNIYYTPEILTYISILFALGINVFLIKKYAIYIPSFVLVWAAFGIIMAQGNTVTQIISGISIIIVILVSAQNYLGLKK